MSDTLYRRRVERLLQGDRRIDDVMQLFLFARDRFDGRESVQEVGDFCAHYSERTKGPATRSVRRFFSMIYFKVNYLNQDINIDDLDRSVIEFLYATASHATDKFIRNQGSLSRKFAIRRSNLLKDWRKPKEMEG